MNFVPRALRKIRNISRTHIIKSGGKEANKHRKERKSLITGGWVEADYTILRNIKNYKTYTNRWKMNKKLSKTEGCSTGWKEFSELLEPNENENITAQSFWDVLTPFTRRTWVCVPWKQCVKPDSKGGNGGWGREGTEKVLESLHPQSLLDWQEFSGEAGMWPLGGCLVTSLGRPFPLPSHTRVPRELNKEREHMCRCLTCHGSLIWK